MINDQPSHTADADSLSRNPVLMLFIPSDLTFTARARHRAGFQGRQRKLESRARIAHLDGEMEPERAASSWTLLYSSSSLRNMRTNLVSTPPFIWQLNFSPFVWLLFCPISLIATFVTHIHPLRLAKNARFCYISELAMTHVILYVPSLFP